MSHETEGASAECCEDSDLVLDKRPDAEQVPLAASDPAAYWQRVCLLYRSAAPAILGNVLEWYDWTVYGYMEDLMQVLFMNGSSSATWLVFAVPFVARPLGSALLGWVGDRCGRKMALNLAIWGMSLATVLQGCLVPSLPGAGVLLCLLRIVSGLSAGGEAGMVNTYMTEFGGKGRDSTLAAAVGVNNVSGSLAFYAANVASLLVHRLSRAQQLDWGWRVPFLLAAPVGLLSVHLRRSMPETEAYLECSGAGPGRAPKSGEESSATTTTEESAETSGPEISFPVTLYGAGTVISQARPRQQDRSPEASDTGSHVWEDVRGIMLTVVVIAAINSCNYLPLYLAGWLRSEAGFSASAALGITALSKTVQTLATFPASYAGDRWGATLTMIVGGVAAAVVMVPSMLLVALVARDATPGEAALVGCVVLGLLLPFLITFYLLPSNLFMTSLFPTARRARGAGLGLGLASIAGGLTPMACSALAVHGALLPGAFVSLLAVPSLAALCWSRHAASHGRLTVHQRPQLF